jgi:HlyD family secretion protein
MIRKNLFIIFWVLIIVVLLLFSLVFKDTNKAIVAQVEPMKKAISYHKAVKIIEVYVIPGQRVKPGDLLVKVERPDLILDVEKKTNEIERLKVERSLAESKYAGKQQLLKLEKEAELRKIEDKMEQLNLTVANNQQISSQFGSLTGYADSVKRTGKSYYEIEMEALKQEKEFIQEQFFRSIQVETELYEEEIKGLDIVALQLQQELDVLLDEEQQLVKKAEINGTVGSVSVQPGELLSPYTTILSIYEKNPTVIKAIMNEGYSYDAHVGQQVIVESSNRSYKIEGNITEIGARIIEYPNRLRSNQNIAMWGQELFIRIPAENKFLNGERVFVKIKK